MLNIKKKLSKAIFLAAVATGYSASLFANITEESSTVAVVSSYGDIKVNDQLNSLPKSDSDAVMPATALSVRASSLPAAWHDYIQFNGFSMNFLNYTFECRVAIMYSSNPDGFYQIYNHRAEPFETFVWPPATPGRHGGSSRGPITTIACDGPTPPGINY